MLASHVRRGTAIMLAAVLLAVLAGSSQDVEPSALEKDPSGWIDMLATTGSPAGRMDSRTTSPWRQAQ